MSDADSSGTPEGAPPPTPAPQPIPTPTSPRASVGAIIVGIFLILFGLCLLLVGGGCTILLILEMGMRLANADGAVWLLIGFSVAGVGLLAIIGGIRLCGGKTKRDGSERSRGRIA